MIDRVRAPAHAKVNLVLEVLGPRPDGYREIRSWLTLLDLADHLVFERAERGVRVEVPAAPELATEDNLAVRAAKAFRRRFGGPKGVRIHLDKRIPIAAGLGGGSSDAAATLRALARMEGVRDDAALSAIAASLGSDVPFFLQLRTAVIAGRGEQVAAAPAAPPCWLLLVKPPFGISAREAYEAWEPAGGALTAPWPDANEWMKRHLYLPPTTPQALGALLANDLQPGAVRKFPQVGSILQRLRALSPAGALMSGSGPTCFAIFPHLQAAEQARRAFRRQDELLLVARPILVAQDSQAQRRTP
ncbi:MAG: 4-(cytidine 5'-diphospho)-2-C-methyl-D-erythritol kinase [Myxococcales bacterium]